MCEIDDVDVNLYLSETMSDDIIQFIWNIGQTYTSVLEFLLSFGYDYMLS
jgi:hypothetical protein